MAGSQDFDCPENAICMVFESPLVLQQEMCLLVIPASFGLLLYGIFTVLFGLCIYIFRHKFMPEKLHIIATLVFYAVATASVILDLVSRCGRIGLSFSMYPNSVGFIYTPDSVNSPALVSASEGLFLCAGSLADAMLIRRCYRLWNSRNAVVLVPVMLVPATLILWIITTILFTSEQAYVAYIGVTLFQNLYLSGMIAGRIWWNNRSMRKIYHATPKPNAKLRRDLFGPVLESAMIIPIFLIIWLALFVSGSGVQVLTSCVLTQVVGISFTLLIVRIGLGINVENDMSEPEALLPSTEIEYPRFEEMPQEESNRAQEIQTQEQPEQDHRQFPSAHQHIQPFNLKYAPAVASSGNDTEPAPEVVEGKRESGSDRQVVSGHGVNEKNRYHRAYGK
ncbi:hypothetical protein C8R42DRAFT_711628 [Lentinula raphanica]|nr:hypothetical protein C8R42DRAFT_711628 [Lentinula raphanica]